MPAETATSSLFKGNKNVVASSKKHAKDAPQRTTARLPDGIENGVARLEDCRLLIIKDGPNKGKPGWFRSGIVLEPQQHNGIKIAGMRTQPFVEPLCDTPQAAGKKKTFDDHWAFMMNELRILNGDSLPDFTDDGKLTDETQVEANLKAFMKRLAAAKPTFNFRTWKGKKATSGQYKDKEPTVNEVWLGSCDYDPDPDSQTNETEDESGGAAEASSNGADETSKHAYGPPNEWLEFQTADVLSKAEADDPDAQTELRRRASERGMTEEQMDSDDCSWQDMANFIDAEDGGTPTETEEESPGEEPAAEWKPEVGQTYQASLLNPKTKKKAKVDADITAVDEAKQKVTVTVKFGKGEKPVKQTLGWDQLIRE